MYDTPAPLRGAFYNTHLYARCPNFHPCHLCQMCTSFNPHDPVCVACENNKDGGRHHTCRPERVWALRMLEEKMGRPLYDLNQEAKTVDEPVMTTALGENAQIMQGLQAEEWTKGR